MLYTVSYFVFISDLLEEQFGPAGQKFRENYTVLADSCDKNNNWGYF